MKIKNNRLAVALLTGALLTTATACGSSSATTKAADGAEVSELKYQGSVGTVTPAELAENLGFLGSIKLKWVGNTISGPQDIQSAATGQTDFGGAFNGAIVKLVAAKAPIKAVISYYGSDKDTATCSCWATSTPAPTCCGRTSSRRTRSQSRSS